MTHDLPGSVPVHVRCGCPDRRVPLHLYKSLLAVLADARVPPEFPIAKHICRRCRITTIVRASDLPIIRLAS